MFSQMSACLNELVVLFVKNARCFVAVIVTTYLFTYWTSFSNGFLLLGASLIYLLLLAHQTQYIPNWIHSFQVSSPSMFLISPFCQFDLSFKIGPSYVSLTVYPASNSTNVNFLEPSPVFCTLVIGSTDSNLIVSLPNLKLDFCRITVPSLSCRLMVYIIKYSVF